MLASEKIPPNPGKVVWQCARCAYIHEEQTKSPGLKCPECGCRVWRCVDVSWGIENSALDRPDPESVKHFKKRLTECLNYSTSAKNPFMKWSHKLELKRVVSREGNQYVKVEEKCATCSLVYNVHCIPLTRIDKLRTALTKEELKQLKLDLSGSD